MNFGIDEIEASLEHLQLSWWAGYKAGYYLLPAATRKTCGYDRPAFRRGHQHGREAREREQYRPRQTG